MHFQNLGENNILFYTNYVWSTLFPSLKQTEINFQGAHWNVKKKNFQDMVGLLAAGDGVKVKETFTLRAGYMSWLLLWYAEGMDCTLVYLSSIISDMQMTPPL